MEDKSKLVSVFAGSMVDATSVKVFLEENNIESVVLNDYQSALDAGWIPASRDVELLINEDDLAVAKPLIEEYLKKY